MKRVLILAAAAVTLLAGCQPVDSNAPGSAGGDPTPPATVEVSQSVSATAPATSAAAPSAAAVATAAIPPSPARRSTAARTATTPAVHACGADYYRNVDGVCVHRPVTAKPGGQPPAGATAKCNDGSYSFSQHRQGTCSHHGGVAVWY